MWSRRGEPRFRLCSCTRYVFGIRPLTCGAKKTKTLPSCCVTAVKIPSKFDLPSTAKTLPSKKGKPSTAKKLPSCCVTVPSKSVKNIVTEHSPGFFALLAAAAYSCGHYFYTCVDHCYACLVMMYACMRCVCSPCTCSHDTTAFAQQVGVDQSMRVLALHIYMRDACVL